MKTKFLALLKNPNNKYYILIFIIISILEYIFYHYKIHLSFNKCILLLAWFTFIYWYYGLLKFEKEELAIYKKNENASFSFFLYPFRILIRYIYIKYKVIKFVFYINKNNKFNLLKLTIILTISLILYRYSRTLFLFDIINVFDLESKFINMLPLIVYFLLDLLKMLIINENQDFLFLYEIKNPGIINDNKYRETIYRYIHCTKDMSSIKKKFRAVLPAHAVSEQLALPIIKQGSTENQVLTTSKNFTNNSIKSKFEIVGSLVNPFNPLSNSESEYMLYDASKNAVRKLKYGELEETIALYGNIKIKKYILLPCTFEAYSIRDMGHFIHTPFGLKQNTFLNLYWFEQYIREPDINKRYAIYINNFFDFSQHFKSINKTYNGGKPHALQNYIYRALYEKFPDLVTKSVDISQAFFKQFANDIRELHNNGCLQLLPENEILQINHFFFELEVIPYINVDNNVSLHFHAIKANKIYGEMDAALILDSLCLSLQSKVSTSWAGKDRVLNTWFNKTKYAYTDMLFFHFRKIFISIRDFNEDNKFIGYKNYIIEPNTNQGKFTAPSLSPDQKEIDQEIINKKVSDQYEKQLKLEKEVDGRDKSLPASYFANERVLKKKEISLNSNQTFRSIEQFKNNKNELTEN